MAVTTNNYSALLYANATTTFNVLGSAVASCAPTGYGNVWIPIQVAVSTTSSQSTIGTLYIGPNLPFYALAGLLGSTQLQNLGTAVPADGNSIGFVSNFTIPYGQAVIFAWEGGSLGSSASMSVTGTQSAIYWR